MSKTPLIAKALWRYCRSTDVMVRTLPKLTPIVLERRRVQAWLESHAKSPVRYVCAPAGSGKTTSAVLYARRHPESVAFLSLEAQISEQELIAAIGHSLVPAMRRSRDVSCAGNYAELIERLTDAAPIEIIVDDVDNAGAAARDVLSRLYLDVPDTVTFMYLGRSDGALRFSGARATGLVAACDPALFAFDANEIAQLAESFGVTEDRFTASILCEVTHGWAIAVRGACSKAAEKSLPLREALQEWCREHRTALHELVSDTLKGVPPAVAGAFEEVLAGRMIPDRQSLEAFRRAGLFVTGWNGRLALNPLLGGASSMMPTTTLNVAVVPAIIEMFGRFEMTIDQRPIGWIRRRDSEIVAFLAGSPRGRATRAEIIAAFWPTADVQLAGQSLRTACSTIRRAIGACVGQANVTRYFKCTGVLELVGHNTVISSREFAAHCRLAEAADERDDVAIALMHLRAATRLYRSPFLAGEPPAPWMRSHEQEYALMYRDSLELFGELSTGHRVRDARFGLSAAEALHRASA